MCSTLPEKTVRVELAPLSGTTGRATRVVSYSEIRRACIDTGRRTEAERPGVVSPRIAFTLSGQAERNAGDGSLVLSDSKTEPITNGQRKTTWNIKIN